MSSTQSKIQMDGLCKDNWLSSHLFYEHHKTLDPILINLDLFSLKEQAL